MPLKVEISHDLKMSVEIRFVGWIRRTVGLRILFGSGKDPKNLTDAERNEAANSIVEKHYDVDDEFTGMINMLAKSEHKDVSQEFAVKAVDKGLAEIQNIHKNASPRRKNNKKVGN
jgi:hypothetical protein